MYAAYKRLTSAIKTHRLSEGIEKGTPWKKKAGVAILISEKIDLKTKTVTRDKERHYIMIKDQSKKKI